MNILTLSGWAQPADAIARQLNEPATVFDYSVYGSLDATFDALEKHRSMPCVVGWSMGGELALQAIAAGVLQPEKLALIAAPYQFVSGDGFAGGMDPLTFQLFRDSYTKDPVRTKQRFHALIAKGDSKARAVMDALEHHPEVDDTARWLPLLERLGAASLRGLHLSSVPSTLILHGENDQIVPIAQGEKLLQTLPNAHLERWEGTGHAPHLHDKVKLNEALARHIEK